MSDLPAPPLVDGCDVSGLDGFMLDASRLMSSELMAISTGDEFKAAVTLWCQAWRQTPAASLPDDDRIIAAYAGYARDPKGWAKVREMALRGFVLCADGRLYHMTLAADANRAWKARKQRQDAIAKRWSKNGDAAPEERVKTQPNKRRNTAEHTTVSSPVIPETRRDESPNGDISCAAGAGDGALPELPQPKTTLHPEAKTLIAEFDRAIVAVWGGERGRPWPHPKDSVTATRWVDAGITPDLVNAVAVARMAQMRRHGQPPPSSLAYLTDCLMDALTDSAKPLGARNDRSKSRRNDHRTEADDRAAIFAALSGELEPGGAVADRPAA